MSGYFSAVRAGLPDRYDHFDHDGMHRDDFLYDECLFYDCKGKKYPVYAAGSSGGHFCRHRGEYFSGGENDGMKTGRMEPA